MLLPQKKFLIATLTCLFLLTAENFVSALEINLPGMPQNPDLPEYINYFFNFLTKTAGLISLSAIVIGGLYYLISLGIGKVQNEGKEWIKSGILGLLLVMSSYLILNTLNPNLVSLKWDQTLKIPIPEINFNPGVSPVSKTTIVYNKIPAGKLVEEGLTKKIDCFDFDNSGEPIDGDLATRDIIEPSLENHDRFDCVEKIAQAVEKKAALMENLSYAITDLMNQCQCDPDTCDLKDENCTCEYNGACPGNENDIGTSDVCQSTCDKSQCKPKTGESCCPEETKAEIENGPIDTELPGCDSEKGCVQECIETKDYDTEEELEMFRGQCEDQCNIKLKGLDEFRTQYNDPSKIITAAETQIRNNKVTPPKTIMVIKKNVWDNLHLIDKIQYLKEKIKESDFSQDLENISKAKQMLSSSSCYFVKSSAAMWQINQDTIQANYNLQINNDFYTSENGQSVQVDDSKYCKGYQYNNSDYFYSCQKMCPLENNQSCIASCSYCGNIEDEGAYQSCMENQKNCVNNCILQSQCDTGSQNFNNFRTCMDYFKNDCKKTCDNQPAKCEDCKEECENNSRDLLQNLGSCAFSFDQLVDCAKEYNNNKENFNICVKSISWCPYASDQHPGGAECLSNSAFQSKQPFSSYDLYKKPQNQKCQVCYPQDENGNNNNKNNINFYPECYACPSCSNCSQCPLIERTASSGRLKQETSEDLINASANCADESYDGDPATFYCRQGSPNDEEKEKSNEPLSKNFICPKQRNIPIGQTIDQTEEWLKEVQKAIDDFVKKLDNDPRLNAPIPGTDKTIRYAYEDPESGLIQYAKAIGQETGYCQCDSKCDPQTDETPCNGNCIYYQFELPENQNDGVDEAGGGYDDYDNNGDFNFNPNDLNDPDSPFNDLWDIITEKNAPDNGEDWWNGEGLGNTIENGANQNDNGGNTIWDGGWDTTGPGSVLDLDTTSPLFRTYASLEGENDNGGSGQWVCGCFRLPCMGNPCLKMVNLLNGKSAEENCPKQVELKGIPGYHEDISKLLEAIKKLSLEKRSEILKMLSFSREQFASCGSIFANLYPNEATPSLQEIKLTSCQRVMDNFLAPAQSQDQSVKFDWKNYKGYCYGTWLGAKAMAEKKSLTDDWFCCENATIYNQ